MRGRHKSWDGRLEAGAMFREIDRGGTRLEAGRMSDRAVARTVQRLEETILGRARDLRRNAIAPVR